MNLVVSQQNRQTCESPVDAAANARAFLVSGDTGFITGQILHVDDGFSRSGAKDATRSERDEA